MRRLLARAILLAAFSAASMAWGGSKPLVFVPDQSVPADQLDGSVFSVAGEHFAARLVLLDEPTRQQWLLRHTGAATDPFATLPGKPPSFMTFLLDLQCRGDGRIYFQPIGSRLFPADGDVRTPLDVPSIQSYFEMLERKLPLAYEEILNKVLLQRQVELAPGSRATGLLAFRVADMRLRRFRIELSLTGPEGQALGFDAPYVAVKAEQAKERP